MFTYNISFISIITLQLLIIPFSKSTPYDYSNILSKESKISLTLNFETPISSLIPIHSQNPFDMLFYSYYETELPLHNGARMHCFIPSPKPLDIPSHSSSLSNTSSIQNISLSYGYAYLHQINSQCYSVYIDKWMYTLCPSKMVIQTLRMLKEDPKTHKLTKEINYIGYGRNYTNISSKYELYYNTTTIPTIYNNTLNTTFVIDDRILKIYDTNKLKGKYTTHEQFKIIIELIYKINEFKKENNYNNIRISKYVPNINSYEKTAFNKTHVTIIREVLYIISESMFYLDYNIPLSSKYESIVIKNVPKDKSRYSKYKTQEHQNKNKLNVDKDFIFCSFCDFSICGTDINENKYCFITDTLNKETRVIIAVYDSMFAKMGFRFSNSGTLNQDSFIFWRNDVINAFDNLIQGKGTIAIEGNSIIGKKSNFKEITEFHSKQMNYYIMIISNETLSEYIKCNIQDILTDSLLSINNECEQRLKNYPYENEIYFLYREDSLKQNTFSYKEHKVNFTYLQHNTKLNNDINFNINLINSIAINNMNSYSDLNEKGNITFPFKFQISFNLTSQLSPSISRSSLHLYLSHSTIITPFDYEIIIDSKKGIVIKQINNQTSISFYYTEKTSFIDPSITSSLIDIVIFNNYIYISTSDSSLYKSFKLKHYINETMKINYIHIDKAKSSLIKISNIKLYNDVQLEEKIDMMMFDRKYLLNENATFVDVFENGDYCDVIKANRTVTAYYSCDKSGESDLVIVDVKEDKLCEYVVYAESRFLCNPDVLMRKPIRQSNTNVNCVNANEKYNHNIEEFFKAEG